MLILLVGGFLDLLSHEKLLFLLVSVFVVLLPHARRRPIVLHVHLIYVLLIVVGEVVYRVWNRVALILAALPACRVEVRLDSILGDALPLNSSMPVALLTAYILLFSALLEGLLDHANSLLLVAQRREPAE